MDYYTYQQNFAESLNQFINQNQQQIPSPSNEYLNHQYGSSNDAQSNCNSTSYSTPSFDNQSCDTTAAALTYNDPTDYSYYDPITQPSPQIYELSFPSVSSNASYIKTDDESWIETWLSKIGKHQPSTKKPPLTEPNKITTTLPNIQIDSVKQSLNECFQILDQLKQIQKYLEVNVADISTTEWISKTSEIGIAKANFSKAFAQFERSKFINYLRITVEKRRKKRLAQKRRKQNRRNCISEMLDDRQKLHKNIDQWLEAMKEEVERAKVEENMKKEADSVLAEVTKKKSDARKSLSLISSLVKLRHLREQTATQKGEIVSLEDSAAFSKATDHLKKIWDDALNVYSKEEQGLRMMLEETVVEDNNAARIAKEHKITHEWDAVLFGPKRMPSAAYYGLMAAEKDLEIFIAVRKSWDTFLTSSNNEYGTSIPIGWVTPNSNPQKNWSNYLDAF